MTPPSMSSRHIFCTAAFWGQPGARRRAVQCHAQALVTLPIHSYASSWPEAAGPCNNSKRHSSQSHAHPAPHCTLGLAQDEARSTCPRQNLLNKGKQRSTQPKSAHPQACIRAPKPSPQMPLFVHKQSLCTCWGQVNAWVHTQTCPPLMGSTHTSDTGVRGR